MTLGMQIPDAKRKRETVRGTVVDNNDPLQLRRVRVQAPSIYGDAATEDLPWAMVDKISGNGIGNSPDDGTFGVMTIGTAVWIEFQADDYGNDDHDLPLVTAFDITQAVQKAEELVDYPNRYGFKDKVGNLFYVDRQTKEVQINLFTNKVTIHVDQNGNIDFTTQGNINQTVQGNVTQHVVGNVTQQVDGNLQQTINGTSQQTVKGAVTMTFQQGATLNITGNLSATISGTTTWNNTGNVTLTTPTATLNGNLVVNGSILASSGITASGGNISASAGNISAGSGDVSDSSGTLSALRSAYDAHKHTGVSSGSSSTGPTDHPV